jgi:hypothetical protein
VPQDTSFSGRLVDGGGSPLVGPVSFNLSVFDAETGGANLYSEQHAGVPLDAQGNFSVLLGSGAPLSGSFDADLFWEVDRYVEVELIAPLNETLAPRVAIASVPWALVAQQANEIVPNPDVPPVNRYLSLPSSAFTARSPDLAWDGNESGTGRFFGNGTHLYAPVELPHGATVDHFRCAGQKALSNANVFFTLRRNQPQVANVDMAEVSNTGTAVGFQILTDTTITSPDINNSAYNYYIIAAANDGEFPFACSGCSVAYCRIRYTVDVP